MIVIILARESFVTPNIRAESMGGCLPFVLCEFLARVNAASLCPRGGPPFTLTIDTRISLAAITVINGIVGDVFIRYGRIDSRCESLAASCSDIYLFNILFSNLRALLSVNNQIARALVGCIFLNLETVKER